MKRSGHCLRSLLVLLSALVLSVLAAGCSGTRGDEVGEIDQSLCSAVTVTSNDADATAVPGQTVLWTSSPACTGSPQYQFWFRSPAGVWTMVQDWSAANTYSWNTTGLAVGTWQMQVWVRDIPSGSYQAYQGKPFVLQSSAACTAITSTVTPGSGTAGTMVNFTNVASTCTTPEYQIYHLAPGGAWNVDSAYSTANANYNWNTTGAATGVHQFQIWTRTQGSTRTYEAYVGKTFTVTVASPCTAAGLAFSPVAHTSVGSPVTLTASASGCGAATFRYFYQPPGGAYIELQPYTSSSTVVWNTTLAPAGVYNFQVWARAVGSTASYEATVGKTYTLTASASTSGLSIGGGFANNCLLTSTGKVGCWGYDTDGQSGNGSIGQSNSVPVAVTGVTTGISLGVGYSYACAALVGGSVRCWGSNLHGQLGNGTTTSSAVPVSVSNLTSAASVAAGNSHACAALADGSVRCWGYNSQGQLGNGLKTDSAVPVVVSGISGATQVSAAYYHSCALTIGGTVRCWGLGTGGQLGDGTGTTSLTPVTVSGLSGVTSISSNSSDNCALKSDGTIWCWGGNTPYGTLGSGSTASQLVPVQVPGVTTARSIAMGTDHACASLQGGTAICWGYNAFGQLGNASTTDSLVPVTVSNLTNVASVGVALYSTCATLNDNTASCWGYGVLGSLGNGANKTSNIPVAVTAVP